MTKRECITMNKAIIGCHVMVIIDQRILFVGRVASEESSGGRVIIQRATDGVFESAIIRHVFAYGICEHGQIMNEPLSDMVARLDAMSREYLTAN